METTDNWRDNARCADPDLNPNLWFADPSEEQDRGSIIKAREEMCTARDICRLCPVRNMCLEYAMYRPFLQGIWGGLSAGERETMRQIRVRNDDSLVTGLFSEPDISAYTGGNKNNKQSDAIIKALRARRICKVCKEEKEYYISRIMGMCEDCAMVKSQEKSQTS